MPEMKTLNGYEVVDAKARQDIEVLKNTEVDLTSYALKSELPTKVSQLQNDSRFITLEEVPETDLSAYAKKTDIPDVSGFITSIPSEYVTESELNAKGYLTAEDLPESIDTSRFLTKVDNNDQYMWYATTTNANQVIQNHVPIEKTDSKLDVVVGGKTLNNNTIAVREGLQIRVPEAPTKAGHAASKAYVDKAIAAIPEVDLSSYAKKSDIPTKTSQLANDSNYLTAIPSEYITETELDNKGYLTEHQSLTDYAKKSEIPTVPTKTSQLTNDSNFLTAIPSEYITESELNAKGYLTEHQSLSDYAKKSEIPDVSHFITSIPEEYVTETELNNKGYLTQHQSLEGYATKTYVDTAVDDCKDVFFLDFSNATTTAQPATAQMIEFGERFFMKEKIDISVMIKDTQSNYFYPAVMDRQFDTRRILFVPIAINLNTINGSTPCTWGTISLFRVYEGSDYVWKYELLSQGTSTTIATKSYVDNAVSGVSGGGGSWQYYSSNFSNDTLWHVNDYGLSNIRHLRLVGKSSIDSNKTFTIDISSPDTSVDLMTCDREFIVPNVIESIDKHYLTLSSRENCYYLADGLAEVSAYTALGFWYWQE